ncbi:hypothetical protein FisN_2Hh124 [Fistulifera solaris]|jgi:hypothetical protein|uniref:C3H1-type domain-containing protein n=1 Tax=Fistulifera solaris TaxID=1519565 RepID=A0A1Z5KPF9_FISSO|nr:hypothetical protein FisN_2Hh124 [Fistulifera solaris]|eukprot:GAX28057.1 hypothetical protein FisN_2Hh124 [Fistulifera solaris]
MTRLQYSGRWKPVNSKKWVRTVEPANVPKHSWKRPVPEMTSSSLKTPKEAFESSEMTVSAGYQVSRNKLIRKDVESETVTSANHGMTASEPIQTIETSQKDAKAKESSSQMAAPSGYLVSRNKLIRKDVEKETALTPHHGMTASIQIEEAASNETAGGYKVSRNKLVRKDAITEPTNGNYKIDKKNSRRLTEDDAAKEVPSQPVSQNSDAVCKYSRVSKKRKRPAPAKRIHVDSTDEEKPEDEEEERGKKVLTDFAYRETKSQGLVRVQKDAVCPTFLQGIECTNVRCLKRHDVPAEQAMPICSFFQRKGMCLKEDCKFRHVKVSVGALNCPNFERKGYCDDVSCKLMHRNRPRVQPKRSIT